MIADIQGLHHVTSLASGAVANNAFFTRTLGLRRVKTTVNFDKPEVYHLYYGDERGSAGTVMTYFPFPKAARGKRGAGEVAEVCFAVPEGSLDAWAARLAGEGVASERVCCPFGGSCLQFQGPDGESLAMVETTGDTRAPWTGGDVPKAIAVRGFAGVRITLRDTAPTADLLGLMGYRLVGRDGAVSRYALAHGNGADTIELDHSPDAPHAVQGAGSVHHIAFSVADRAAQARVHDALTEAGFRVTRPLDRSYFWAIYFRSPGGVLFEVATEAPGFDADEDLGHLGEGLQLPQQHAHLRPWLQENLEPLDA